MSMVKRHANIIGRRKTAVAKLIFKPAEELKVIINGKEAGSFFPQRQQKVILEPLHCLKDQKDADNVQGEYNIKVHGGGVNAQAEAVRLALARFIVSQQTEWKKILKTKKLLTRNARMKERKKPGLKRARRAPQWSKR